MVIGWNLAVILMGALVRATGSGGGCGRSWPMCRGVWIPAEIEGATRIEYAHRSASGLALALVIALAVLVFRQTRSRHPARRAAVAAMIAIVGEALIGAVIVLSEWVAGDASSARVVAVPLHLVNTLFLLSALVLTVYHLGGGDRLVRLNPWMLLVGVGLVLVAATGAVTALADTLFPKEGVSFDTGEHFLTRLRIVHPAVAAAVGVAAAAVAARHPSPAGRWVVGLVVGQFVLGALNVMLSTPVWLTLPHLLAADLLWIVWVWLVAESSREPAPLTEAAQVI